MPCIDAMTPSWPNRGMSAALMCCACSIRQRSCLPFFSGCRLNVSSKMFSDFAVAAVADRVDRTPGSRCCIASSAVRRMSSSVSVFIPLVVGRSAYGSSIQAPRDPSAPSIGALDGAHREPLVAVVDDAIFRHVGRELVGRFAQHHPDAHRQLAFVDHLLHHARSSAGGDPASLTVVSPFDSALARRELDDPCADRRRPGRASASRDRGRAHRR